MVLWAKYAALISIKKRRKKNSLHKPKQQQIVSQANPNIKMVPPSPASAASSSENVPLFADKHVQFVAGFAKVSQA